MPLCWLHMRCVLGNHCQVAANGQWPLTVALILLTSLSLDTLTRSPMSDLVRAFPMACTLFVTPTCILLRASVSGSDDTWPAVIQECFRHSAAVRRRPGSATNRPRIRSLALQVCSQKVTDRVRSQPCTGSGVPVAEYRYQQGHVVSGSSTAFSVKSSARIRPSLHADHQQCCQITGSSTQLAGYQAWDTALDSRHLHRFNTMMQDVQCITLKIRHRVQS